MILKVYTNIGNLDEGRTCVVCNSSLPNCEICSSTTVCTKCKSGYYIYNAQCVSNCATISTKGFIFIFYFISFIKLIYF